MRKLHIRAMAFVALLAGLMAFAVPSLALMVRPIVIDMTSTGSGSTGSIEVINDRNRAVAVEINVQNLALPQRGAGAFSEGGDGDFLIFPTIAQIEPGERQVFRVRYVGEPDIDKSKLYMFATSELPVDVDPTETKAKSNCYIPSALSLPFARSDLSSISR